MLLIVESNEHEQVQTRVYVSVAVTHSTRRLLQTSPSVSSTLTCVCVRWQYDTCMINKRVLYASDGGVHCVGNSDAGGVGDVNDVRDASDVDGVTSMHLCVRCTHTHHHPP